mmetsp:Transcript_15365/g.2568  ORF Transcript_15365/g.2568 Transcript_15365/m.2568 type:complete len:115 (+) Transcript_15365:1588-1932(+)
MFLINIIKDLLSLCDGKRGKENKAVVATNIMYVVMKYPRFLNNHWNFLKTVVNKLFEFMHEPFEGIKDMSVDTFLSISKSCGELFLSNHPNETAAFVYEIIEKIPQSTCDLEKH